MALCADFVNSLTRGLSTCGHVVAILEKMQLIDLDFADIIWACKSVIIVIIEV